MTEQHEQLVGPFTHPFTGEVLDLPATRADALVDVLEQLELAREQLNAFEQTVEDELAARVDRLGTRKAELDGVELEVNAPTEDEYLVDVLREELERLVKAELIDPALVRSLIVYPQPKRPAARVDRRRAAALARSDVRELVAALEAARRRKRTTRTVKVLRRAITGTATEAPR